MRSEHIDRNSGHINTKNSYRPQPQQEQQQHQHHNKKPTPWSAWFRDCVHPVVLLGLVLVSTLRLIKCLVFAVTNLQSQSVAFSWTILLIRCPPRKFEAARCSPHDVILRKKNSAQSVVIWASRAASECRGQQNNLRRRDVQQDGEQNSDEVRCFCCGVLL